MALIIPTDQSTFGDATSVPGGPLSSYVLAQLPGKAELSWVSDMRSLLVVDELKWKLFQERREWLQAKSDLWKRVRSSMKSATIIVIKPTEIEDEIRALWTEQGAEEGADFDRDDLINTCATALIADTPVAYLPNHIARTLGLYALKPYLSFDRFAPESIKARIGGRLRDAKVFAARAHATFDTARVAQPGQRTVDVFRRPGAGVILRELLATERGFDEEHQKSVDVLNEASDVMAHALAGALARPGELSTQPLVREFSSRDVDQIQAADVAAGWAHELIALSNERALLETFGRVLLNGRVLT